MLLEGPSGVTRPPDDSSSSVLISESPVDLYNSKSPLYERRELSSSKLHSRSLERLDDRDRINIDESRDTFRLRSEEPDEATEEPGLLSKPRTTTSAGDPGLSIATSIIKIILLLIRFWMCPSTKLFVPL